MQSLNEVSLHRQQYGHPSVLICKVTEESYGENPDRTKGMVFNKARNGESNKPRKVQEYQHREFSPIDPFCSFIILQPNVPIHNTTASVTYRRPLLFFAMCRRPTSPVRRGPVIVNIRVKSASENSLELAL